MVTPQTGITCIKHTCSLRSSSTSSLKERLACDMKHNLIQQLVRSTSRRVVRKKRKLTVIDWGHLGVLFHSRSRSLKLWLQKWKQTRLNRSQLGRSTSQLIFSRKLHPHSSQKHTKPTTRPTQGIRTERAQTSTNSMSWWIKHRAMLATKSSIELTLTN